MQWPNAEVLAKQKQKEAAAKQCGLSKHCRKAFFSWLQYFRDFDDEPHNENLSVKDLIIELKQESSPIWQVVGEFWTLHNSLYVQNQGGRGLAVCSDG